MSGAVGTCISLAIVGGIIGGYGSDLVNHKSAGWAGIAFIYIYDINFSYSFGRFPPPLPPRGNPLWIGIWAPWEGVADFMCD